MGKQAKDLTDAELIAALRNCGACGPCASCPFREPSAALDCQDRLMTEAAARLERSEDK